MVAGSVTAEDGVFRFLNGGDAEVGGVRKMGLSRGLYGCKRWVGFMGLRSG